MKNENQTDVAFEELKARNLRAVRLRDSSPQHPPQNTGVLRRPQLLAIR